MQVRFPTASPSSFRALREGRGRQPVEGHGTLFLPNEAGRHPGVVICPGLSGPTTELEYRYADWLATRGYAALVVDSFAMRGAARWADPLRLLRVTPATMLADAYAARAFMANLSTIEPDAISVMGFAYGGMIAVLAAYEQMRRLFVPRGEQRFAAHASYYGCSMPRLTEPVCTGAPVLMMVGDRDGTVSIARSREIADDLRRGGADVQLEVLAGCHHQWDGQHAEPRQGWFSLAGCRFRVDRHGATYDEATGRRIDSMPGYLLFLAMHVRPRRYTMLRDDRAARRTDDMLLALLDRASGSRPRAAAQGARLAAPGNDLPEPDPASL